MSTDDSSFFSRWSRRKEAARSGQALPPEPVAAPVPAPAAVAPATVPATPVPHNEPEEPKAPPPTLDDVAQLTPESDFRRFVGKDVPGDVRLATFPDDGLTSGALISAVHGASLTEVPTPIRAAVAEDEPAAAEVSVAEPAASVERAAR